MPTTVNLPHLSYSVPLLGKLNDKRKTMLEEQQDIMRCIVEYSGETEEVIAKYELSNFDLEKFQKEFGIHDSENPMFDCYQVTEVNTPSIQRHLVRQIDWNFEKRDYFLEAFTM